MNDTILNVIVIALGAVTLGFFIQTIFSFKLTFPKAYMNVCQVTKQIENERESNQGKHFDESVYLEKAESIRLNSRFFDFVNEVDSNE